MMILPRDFFIFGRLRRAMEWVSFDAPFPLPPALSPRDRGRFGFFHLPNYSGGIAGNDGKGRHIRSYYGAGTDDCALADGHARQHTGIETDPDVGTDMNRL